MTVIEALKLAFLHYQTGRRDEAVMVCRAILAAVPDQPETLHLLGIVHHAAGRPEESAAHIKIALALRPDFADAMTNLGVMLSNQGAPTEAERWHDRALRINPTGVEILINRGSAFLTRGRFQDAADAYREAVALRPNSAAAFNGLGAALRELGKGRLSQHAHQRAAALEPAMVDAYRDLGHLMREAGMLTGSRDAYGRAFRLQPAQTEYLSYYLFAKQAMCDWTDYDVLIPEIRRIMDEDAGLVLPLAMLAIDTTPAQQLRAAERFYRTIVTAAPSQTVPAPRAAGDGRLRVAYLSADFHQHATAYLAAELFELHDRDRFRISAYSYGIDDESPMRRRLVAGFDAFHDIRGVSADDVAALAASEGIDILVDLKGYTKQSRFDLLRARMAPIQAAYLGYPGTIGCPLMDYVIGDRFVTPPEFQPYYTERLVIMPDAYQINDRRRTIAEPGPTRAECGLPDDAFVFCSFNTTYKITPEIFRIWMRLLAQTPGSLLWLFEANPDAAASLRRSAAAAGIDPARLVFAPKRPLADHLARYRLADLFVDTYPYTGHTTTSDALWAGLPVVTVMGDSFASRVAASLLNAAGLPETVTTSFADYEALALALARDPARIASYRERLVRTRFQVPLFDSLRFTHSLERAYETMWAIHRAGEPPRGFAVEAP